MARRSRKLTGEERETPDFDGTFVFRIEPVKCGRDEALQLAHQIHRLADIAHDLNLTVEVEIFDTDPPTVAERNGHRKPAATQ